MNKLVCVMTDKERESVDKKETKIFCTELTEIEGGREKSKELK